LPQFNHDVFFDVVAEQLEVLFDGLPVFVGAFIH